MKSYFAKLADRATLANVPAPSSVHASRVPDPFEDASRDEYQPSPLNPRLPQEKFHHPEGFAYGQTSDSSRPGQTVKTIKSDKTDSPGESSELSISPLEPSEQIIYKVEPKEAQAIEPRSEHALVEEQTINREVREVVTLLPNIAPEVQPIPANDSSDEEQSPTQISESTIDVRADEALLQRKADLFMSSLFEGTQAKITKNENERSESSQPTPKLEREPVGRLEPLQTTSPQTVQEPEGPSLVIGKLTVEIAPSAPPPSQPQPQRIVVRGSRGRATRVMSSHRFGLGQF